MDIDTGDSPPVSSRPYTLPLKHYKLVQREIESLECTGVITKSMSKWASPIVVVPKKSAPGEPLKRRLCVDFRKVNELQQEVITAGKTNGQISIHPLPKIDEMYVKLKGAKVFSTIDLRSGYHHIALGKSSRAKTTFVMPFGKYEFLMVPFGLAQAPAYFQLLMNKVLKGLKFAMTNLDYIIIFSQDELQHLEHLEIVFSHLWEAGLKMKCSKCDFFKSEIHYLGHLISPEGISPLPNRLDSIRHMPVQYNWAMELKAFNIQFDYIKGSSNILVDTLSHLVAIDPDTPTTPEEPGYEFGYAIFEEFPKVQIKSYEVNEVIVGTDTKIIKNDPELQKSLQCIQNPITPQRLRKLQQQDSNIEILKRKLQNNRLDKEYYSLDENELLTRKVIDGGHKFLTIYLPSVLIFQVLRTAHDDLGNNGFPRTYAALK